LVINETKTWIKTQDLTFVASEADNYALEAALRLKDKHGGEVIVVSLGGEEAAKVLRAGLAMGADRAIHLADEKFRNSGEYGTAEVLAKAIEKDGGADLVLAGVQSDDLGTGATGVMLAEFLSWSHATVVISVDSISDAKTVTVQRELEGGLTETAELSLPSVLTIQYGANQPRYASLKGIMAAKKKPVEAKAAPAAEARIEVLSMEPPPARAAGRIVGKGKEAVTELVRLLRDEAKVL
jgi:electron transfer flavoprotein beta subunit